MIDIVSLRVVSLGVSDIFCIKEDEHIFDCVSSGFFSSRSEVEVA